MGFVTDPKFNMAGLGLSQALDYLSPKAPIAPTAPTPEEIVLKQDEEAQKQARRLSRGRTSTILSGAGGVTGEQTSQIILGQ